MKFEDIFEKEGLYRSESFRVGVCFKVDKQHILTMVTYSDANDLIPCVEPVQVYGGLFKKEFKKVYTIQSLFKNNDN